MEKRTRMLIAIAIAIAASTASCGTSNSGSADGGRPNLIGTTSSGGGAGASSGGAGSGGAGSGGASSGVGGANGNIALPDGAMYESCNAVGTTRTCCTTGTQTCVGNEFAAWTQCVDSAGAALSCSTTGGGCDSPIGCDGGADSGPPPPPPSDGAAPPPPAACSDQSVNNEPEILVGYSPASGQSVGAAGQIKVWVSDENSPFIAPGEQVDNTTGAVTAPGNRTATASDGLLYEPALYFAPQSPTSGGTPYFPQWIKGSYNNNPPNRGTFTGGAAIDPIPPGARTLQYTGEFVWDVSALGIGPGTYTGVFSVHDGDHDRAIGCITIVIQ